MTVLDTPQTRPRSGLAERSSPDAARRVSRAAPLLTVAAAAAGAVEVLLVRIVVPALSHAAPPALGSATSALNHTGTVAMGAAAILVLCAATAWAAVLWPRHRVLGAATGLAAAATTVATVTAGDATATVVHVSVAVAAVGVLAIRQRDVVHVAAMASAVAAVVAGQLALVGIGDLQVAVRAFAEALAVVALILLAIGNGLPASRRAYAGLVAGAVVATVAMLSSRAGLVALWAVGAPLWMPSLVYVAAGGAAGVLIADWLVDRDDRVLLAAVGLLAVAGLEPTLVHHNLTALVGLVALATGLGRGTAS